jgi:hypothetical protein
VCRGRDNAAASAAAGAAAASAGHYWGRWSWVMHDSWMPQQLPPAGACYFKCLEICAVISCYLSCARSDGMLQDYLTHTAFKSGRMCMAAATAAGWTHMRRSAAASFAGVSMVQQAFWGIQIKPGCCRSTPAMVATVWGCGFTAAASGGVWEAWA